MRDILQPVDLADLRVTVLGGDEVLPSAFVVTCDSVGQLDLGWIEDSDAPISWRAAAYAAVEAMLGRVLPVFGYQDLFDEIACYYWDGATDDEAAREALIACYGADEDDLEHQSLPSTMNARRPAWMIAANGSPSADLPVALRQLLDGVRQSHDALAVVPPDSDAWHVNFEIVREHLPALEECSHLPPLTLVPVEQFACEVDDVGRHGMEIGFMDVAGLYPLNDAARIDGWFASLRLGTRFLCAVQDLLRFDPSNA